MTSSTATKTKKCSICRKILPVSYFHRRNDSADGYRNACIDCERERNRQTYLARKAGTPIARVVPSRFDRAKMLELAKHGYTSMQIAKEIGCDRSTIYKALKAYDITLKVSPNHHKQTFDRSMMGVLLARGYTQSEVARQLGCSPSVVSRYVALKNHTVKIERERGYKRGRRGMTCALHCAKYPCFAGIDNMSSNLVLTCTDFKKR